MEDSQNSYFKEKISKTNKYRTQQNVNLPYIPPF